MRISDWSSDVCSSDLVGHAAAGDIDARFGDDRRRIARILVIAGVEDGVARIVRDLVDRRRRRGDAIIMILQPAHIAPELFFDAFGRTLERDRSEEHTSELQSLMRSSYDVFCLKKKKK